MNIGIDISQMAYEGTGVANYTKNLILALAEIDKTNNYFLFYSSLRKKLTIFDSQLPKNFHIKNFYLPSTFLNILWNKLHLLPIDSFIGKIDIYHSSDWIQAPSHAKKITTIHDLTPFKFPENLHPKIVETHKNRLKWVAKECDLIICVSKSTQNDVVSILKIPKEKTIVIYEGVAKEFLMFNQLSDSEKVKKITEIKTKYKIKGNYVLSVGTREPRKNIDRLIKAWENIQIKFPNTELVIGGKYGWGKDIDSNNCKILGFVVEEDLPALYAGAKLFAYPSLYEGFGLPVLEAMSVGCPVLTSNVSSLPEVGGPAAFYCDPCSLEDIQGKLVKILMINSKELEKVKNNSKLQASHFSWKTTVEATLKAYEKVF